MTREELLEQLARLPDTGWITVPVGVLRAHVAAPAQATPADDLLTAEQVAEIMGTTVDWVYRQSKRWPFARKFSRKVVRYSRAGLMEFLRQRDAA